MWNDELEQAFEESSTRKGRRRCAPTRDVTRVGETIAYSRLRRDLDDFGQSRLLVLVLQQQLAKSRLLVLVLQVVLVLVLVLVT